MQANFYADSDTLLICHHAGGWVILPTHGLLNTSQCTSSFMPSAESCPWKMFSSISSAMSSQYNGFLVHLPWAQRVEQELSCQSELSQKSLWSQRSVTDGKVSGASIRLPWPSWFGQRALQLTATLIETASRDQRDSEQRCLLQPLCCNKSCCTHHSLRHFVATCRLRIEQEDVWKE